MNIRGLIAIPFSLPFLVNAAPYAYPFNSMTGEQVVNKLVKEPHAEIDFIERDMAHSYLNGIKDATQGTSWCFVGGLLPHELNIEIAASIRATRTSAELKGSAATLLVAELGRRYPCSSRQGETGIGERRVVAAFFFGEVLPLVGAQGHIDLIRV